MKQEAINKLMSQGMTESEAIKEFNDKVNYYLRGTTNTKADYNYALDCAIDDILYNDDIEEYDEDMLELLEDMLELLY